MNMYKIGKDSKMSNNAGTDELRTQNNKLMVTPRSIHATPVSCQTLTVNNNTMFPSYETIKGHRKLRLTRISQLYPSMTHREKKKFIISDKKDMAYLDVVKKEKRQQAYIKDRVNADGTNGSTTTINVAPEIMEKWTSQYGDKAVVLIQTLEKLRSAYDRGRELLACHEQKNCLDT